MQPHFHPAINPLGAHVVSNEHRADIRDGYCY